jgi:rhodanese-related sulfurtransferase
MNPDFDQAIVAAANSANAPSASHAAQPDKASGAFKPHKLMLLCRSGVRSIAAAKRATELGLEAYNILEGFEGDANDSGHRGFKGGWRTRGLPWRQN